ncbi:MAG: hypothetical protein Q8R04_01385, partial [Nanoarchaeota archaeon]|nr:hypothetical protein [Nanoarchaeota archaeon]
NNLKQGLRNIAGGYNGGEGAMEYSKDTGHEQETVWENTNNRGYIVTRVYVEDVMKYYNQLLQQIK